MDVRERRGTTAADARSAALRSPVLRAVSAPPDERSARLDAAPVDRGVRPPSGRTITGVLLTLGVGLVVLQLLLPAGVARDVVYLVALIGSAAVAVVGAHRDPSNRAVRLLAIGLVVSVAGDVVWQGFAWTRGAAPDVSIADVFWLGSYVALAATFFRLLNDRTPLDRAGTLDVLVVFVVTMLVQWELGVGDLVTDGSAPLVDRVVWTLYPTFDGALLALLVRAVGSQRLRGRLALVLGGGITFWLVSDFAYSLFAVSGAFETWLGAGWMIGCMLVAAAAWTDPGAGPADRGDATQTAQLRGRGGIAVALLPMLMPGTVAVAASLRDHPSNPVVLTIATLALFALAYSRAAKVLNAEAAARLALRSQERFAQAVALNSSDAYALLDEVGVILTDAPQLALLTGYPGEPTVGRKVYELVDPLDRDECRIVFARCMQAHGQRFEAELRVRHAEGHHMWMGVRLVNLIDDPDVGGVVVHLHDISDRRRAEAELTHQALHDGLTGLANRALFADRVEHALHRDARTGGDVVVVFLDLDEFKTVNDSLGHAAGDDLLREVARRLEQSVQAGDTVARVGGDEFAVLLEQSPAPLQEAEAVAERILRSFAEPIDLGSQVVSVSASLGIAAGDPDATASALLRDADVAMHRAKAMGRAQWAVYDPEMRAAAVERLRLGSDLIGALDAGQFELVYQPVVELQDEAVVGFEALLRWNHPELGQISPDRFIPLAEESGQIIPIGAWVVQEACRTLAAWHRRTPHLGHLSMAVNVSARQLGSDDLVCIVGQALETSGVAPRSLVVEITESALIQDTVAAASRLADLRALGVRLAIDDFGTGYSSLSYLRQFPVDILKIDRSFINSVTDSPEVPAIVRGLLDLGHTLGLEIVAEGVELAVQRDRLRDEHCDLAQGYLFSRPLRSVDAEALLDGMPYYTSRRAVSA